jgi:acyl carrier protein
MQENEDVLRSRLRRFIEGNFMLTGGGAKLRDGDSFLDNGIVDSTGVLEVISFIQDEFHIEVLDEEMLPENLDSIDKLAAYIQGKAAKTA